MIDVATNLLFIDCLLKRDMLWLYGGLYMSVENSACARINEALEQFALQGKLV